jgi:hypothetical protein
MTAHHNASYVASIRPNESDESAMKDGTTGHHQPQLYEIRVKGRLTARWTAFFDGLTLTPCSDGTTVVRGLVADQAALHGLLRKLSDVGLPLISVTHCEPRRPGAPTGKP